ncbi:hypothetical protein ACGFNU_47660 [Spirillospora sp. NPDC048911]|uniref:hypothetical protein n=1 Tax=Spirillospora sp. NPDC048911 TaxID=3364527 RepID=UPI003717B31F
MRYYLRQRWALDRFARSVNDLAVIYGTFLAGSSASVQETVGSYLTHKDDGSLKVNRVAFLDAISTAIPSTQPVWRAQARALAKRTNDPLKARAHLQELEQRFDVLLQRALRQRNAVVHGIRTVPGIVATVDPFIARLSAFIINDAIESVTIREDLGEVLERRRGRARRMLWRLEQPGAETVSVLYGTRR